MKSPLQKSKEEYREIIEKIGSENSPVGLDAQYTHAVIIDYLQRIEKRLGKIEERLSEFEVEFD